MKHPAGTKPRTVMLVDDHPLVCRGLGQLIDQEDDLTVCCTAGDAGTALEKIERHAPDIAIVDISLKDVSGLELTRNIMERFPSTKVLILSMHDEVLYAERALKAGAVGYLMKEEPPDKVLAAIRRALGGQFAISDSISNRLAQKASYAGGEEPASFVGRLSDRELEIFQLIGLGFGSREIADKLFLGIKTVETHQANIKQKLSFKSGRELARYAVMWVQDRSM